MKQPPKARLVVLASGNGSNLQVLLDACAPAVSASGVINARLVGVLSDKPSAKALERARRAGVEAIALKPEPGMPRRVYDALLAERVAAFEPDWILLLGWMRLLSSAFLDRFPERVVNLHPALPGAYPGVDAIDRAFRDARSGGRQYSGVMCHLVPDEGVDSGPVLASAIVPILAGDGLASFEARMHEAEHALVLSAISTLLASSTSRPVSNIIQSGASRTSGKE